MSCELWGEDGAIRRSLSLPGPCPPHPALPSAAGQGAAGCGAGASPQAPALFLHPQRILGTGGRCQQLKPALDEGAGHGGCPGLTWKRVASLSGEVSPLVWLRGGTGDLGTKGEWWLLHAGARGVAALSLPVGRGWMSFKVSFNTNQSVIPLQHPQAPTWDQLAG